MPKKLIIVKKSFENAWIKCEKKESHGKCIVWNNDVEIKNVPSV